MPRGTAKYQAARSSPTNGQQKNCKGRHKGQSHEPGKQVHTSSGNILSPLTRNQRRKITRASAVDATATTIPVNTMACGTGSIPRPILRQAHQQKKTATAHNVESKQTTDQMTVHNESKQIPARTGRHLSTHRRQQHSWPKPPSSFRQQRDHRPVEGRVEKAKPGPRLWTGSRCTR
jgi:hypothetical protein